ncbi:MAG: hypothetical protein ACD_50C00343G0003 [uncultured bacterium]|nr:MAG: hypothetical protein ACD_50C00343G0003 [uncultured bacterium]OGH13267.1 MAG: hypothetical protein A2687_03945 [Candidatus Levybacteria bacterium RIFCSPHIGHO2_01_FULL_38_26]
MVRPEQAVSLPFVIKDNLSAPEAEQILFSQAKKNRIITCFIRDEYGQLTFVTRKPQNVIEEVDAV